MIPNNYFNFNKSSKSYVLIDVKNIFFLNIYFKRQSKTSPKLPTLHFIKKNLYWSQVEKRFSYHRTSCKNKPWRNNLCCHMTITDNLTDNLLTHVIWLDSKTTTERQNISQVQQQQQHAEQKQTTSKKYHLCKYSKRVEKNKITQWKSIKSNKIENNYSQKL